MKRGAAAVTNNADVVQQLSARNAQLESELRAAMTRLDTLTQQLKWFKRQLFGRKSEKRLLVDSPQQPLLNGLLAPEPSATLAEPTEKITYDRRKRKLRGDECITDEGLRFDESVPVETIELSAPQLQGPDADDYEVIAYKTTRRLAQRAAELQLPAAGRR